MTRSPTLAFLVHDVARMLRADFGARAGRSRFTPVQLRGLASLSQSGVYLPPALFSGTYGDGDPGVPVPRPDGRMVVGTMMHTFVGQPELNLRRIKGILPAAPARARRTIGRTFKVLVDARGSRRSTAAPDRHHRRSSM